jgi:hypothetical protein
MCCHFRLRAHQLQCHLWEKVVRHYGMLRTLAPSVALAQQPLICLSLQLYKTRLSESEKIEPLNQPQMFADQAIV